MGPHAALRARRLVHEGGARPRFARGGRALFFASGGEDEAGQPRGRLMRVPVTFQSAIVVGPPVEVLREVPGGPLIATSDVAADGERFLMWKPVAQPPDGGQRLVFVENALQAQQW